MFEVPVTPETKLIIERAVVCHEGPKAGLMIHRQGPVGEVSRALDGGVEWKIERPHPWAIQVGSYESIPDDDENIVFVDGVRIWLPLIPRPGELGVVVLVREGQLHVEAIDVNQSVEALRALTRHRHPGQAALRHDAVEPRPGN